MTRTVRFVGVAVFAAALLVGSTTAVAAGAGRDDPVVAAAPAVSYRGSDPRPEGIGTEICKHIRWLCGR